MKSIFNILRKYRKKDINIADNYYRLYKKHKKIENYSSLFYIESDDTSKAYFDPHINLVVIINNDEYIDNLFYLYDRKLKVFDSADIETKLKNILENYYNSTKYHFIESLYKNGFVSYYIYTKLKKECF